MSATASTPKPTPNPKVETISVSRPGVKTAKLFKNGRSQAVRLPKEFRFEGTEVAIRRDPATGEILLSESGVEPKKTLPELLELVHSHQLSEDDLAGELQKLGKLALPELYAIFDHAEFPEGFFERETHMPRELDLF